MGGCEVLGAKLLLMASKTNEIADFVEGYESLAGHPMPQKVVDATRDYLTRTHAFLDDLESIQSWALRDLCPRGPTSVFTY